MLGARVGLDQKRVSLIENGGPDIRVDRLFRLLSALEVGIILGSKALECAGDKQGAVPSQDEW